MRFPLEGGVPIVTTPKEDAGPGVEKQLMRKGRTERRPKTTSKCFGEAYYPLLPRSREDDSSVPPQAAPMSCHPALAQDIVTLQAARPQELRSSGADVSPSSSTHIFATARLSALPGVDGIERRGDRQHA